MYCEVGAETTQVLKQCTGAATATCRNVRAHAVLISNTNHHNNIIIIIIIIIIINRSSSSSSSSSSSTISSTSTSDSTSKLLGAAFNHPSEYDNT